MWPVYVINLADATARWRQVDASLRSAGLLPERVEAVRPSDRPDLCIEDWYDAPRALAMGYRALTPAEIGCYLSHLLLWQRIAEGPEPGAVIFEDDAIARPALRWALDTLCVHPGDWDMVKLFAPRPTRAHPAMRLGDTLSLVQPWVVPGTTVAYAIRREAAAILRRRLVPFARPIDVDLKHWWEHGSRIFLMEPQPVSLLGDHESSSSIMRERASRKSEERQSASFAMSLARAKLGFITRNAAMNAVTRLGRSARRYDT
jgi:glycosyl transferase family 25